MGHPAMDLSGRVAVVIGGTSGIGRALATEWGPKGVNVNAIAPGGFLASGVNQ